MDIKLDANNSWIAYQPIWNIENHELLGQEALIRSNLSPDELFRRAAEEGCTVVFDAIIHEMAIESSHSNNALFLNCHPQSLDSLLTYNPEIYKQYDGKIVLEITEVDHVEPNVLLEFCEKAKQEGLQIAIDDFPAGHHHITMLDLIHPDYIKLDISIVKQLGSNIMQRYVKMLMEWSDDNGCNLIAEGIENKEDLIHCRQLNINYGQGFLLGRPLSNGKSSMFETAELKGAESNWR